MRTIERGLTVERLREVLDYDAETGVLTWRTARGSRAPTGKPAGSPNGQGYVVIKIDNRRFLAHRLAWALVHLEFPDRQVDHVNGTRDDNRLSNLRLATNAENQRNRRGKASGLKGITARRGGYQAQICINGQRIWLGDYPTSELAHAAYEQAAVEHYGEFART
jgi:hypothetical protein